ncbi:DUF998 domain-containing protein [Nonomuraea deserti]|uniref:DUF998 domain-containing protein n=2 Tax=Nonomuraea deserti TaxID=1848322 RepID=A0A4R4W2J2_9ACTN|nr:DUF998 domain-containing protein [Nonomuraea deserti]
MATPQVFVVDLWVQAAWRGPYPVLDGYLSDLGNTACLPDACSARHALMNASFVCLGLLLGMGLPLVPASPRRVRTLVGLAALGWCLVGVAPENESMPLHLAGALPIFFCGNAGMILDGLHSWSHDRRRAVWSGFTGAVGSAATGLFLGGQFLGLGQGGMERLAVYAPALWAAGLGAASVLTRADTGRAAPLR